MGPDDLVHYTDVLRKYDCFPCLFSGQYQCFATNEWGTATTNSVFVRKSELNNFKDEPPRTMSVEEGAPFGVECDAPDGWPKPSVYWMLQGQNWLKTINSSRLTVDPEGKLWFSNVTRADSSLDFLYACSAASYFRNEYKLGNNGGFTPNPTIFQEQLCHSVCIFVGNGVKNSIVWYSCMLAVMKAVVVEVAARRIHTCILHNV